MLFAKLKVGQEDECDRLLSSSKTLLRYHSPNCGHCIDMEPQWDALQHDKLLKDTNIAVVDAHVGIADRLKHKSGMDVKGKGVPTIYFIDGDNITEYDGARKTRDIADFALNELRQSSSTKYGGKRKNTRRKKSYKKKSRRAHRNKRIRRSKRK